LNLIAEIILTENTCVFNYKEIAIKLNFSNKAHEGNQERVLVKGSFLNL
jgi:hypothetical protein